MLNACAKYLLPLLMLAVGAWAQTADLTIPCGEIVGMRLVGEDAFTLEWDVRKFKEKPTLEKGEKFAIVMIKLGPNKSIGKYDYTLSGSPCLAMAINPNAFNPLNWEFRDQPEAARIEMLFKVKAAEDTQGYPFLYKYVDRANIFVGKNAGCVSRNINSQVGTGGGMIERPGKGAGAEDAAKEVGLKPKGKKGKKGKKGDEEEEPAAEDAGGGGAGEEEAPAKKKGGDEEAGGGEEKPAKKKDDDAGKGGKKGDEEKPAKKKDDWGL